MLTLQKEYKDRLRPRPLKHEIKAHIKMLHEVTQLKLSEAWRNKSKPFSMLELEKGIKDLNKGKACDPSGWCAELFQTNVMGASLKESLLTM